jgi:hypothetical protein
LLIAYLRKKANVALIIDMFTWWKINHFTQASGAQKKSHIDQKIL